MTSDFDKELKEALLKINRVYLDSLPKDEEIEHEFSPEFEERMEEMMRQGSNKRIVKRGRWRKVLTAAAVVLAVLFAVTMNVSAMRMAIFGFVEYVYENFTDIHFKNAEQVSYDKFVIAKPTYIPEGFEVFMEDSGKAVYVDHRRGDESIYYEQYFVHEAVARLNTGEGIIPEDVEVKGMPGKYYVKDRLEYLMWYDDTYVYFIMTDLSKEELFKIADSVEKIGN